MLNEIRLRFNFVRDTDNYEEGDLYFYDGNPALDFPENPDHEEDFLRYAIEMHCLSLVQDIAQYPLPQLKEIAKVTSILLNAVTHTGIKQRRDLDASLRVSGTRKDWFPHPDAPCQKNLEINHHLGAEGVMSHGRIQDPKGAKHLVISYRTAAGVVAVIVRSMFPLMT